LLQQIFVPKENKVVTKWRERILPQKAQLEYHPQCVARTIGISFPKRLLFNKTSIHRFIGISVLAHITILPLLQEIVYTWKKWVSDDEGNYTNRISPGPENVSPSVLRCRWLN